MAHLRGRRAGERSAPSADVDRVEALLRARGVDPAWLSPGWIAWWLRRGLTPEQIVTLVVK